MNQLLRTLIPILTLSFLTSCGTPGNVRHDPRSLQKISPVYFDLSKEYTPSDYEVMSWTKAVGPGPNLCKGRYIARMKDRRGTYFAPPTDCQNQTPIGPRAFGIWIPDDRQKSSPDVWFTINPTKTKMGVLVDALNSLEDGDYKRGSFKIVTKELLDEFQVKPLESP